MKFLSDSSTEAGVELVDENNDNYIINVDGGRRIYIRSTEPSGVGEQDGDILFQVPA